MLYAKRSGWLSPASMGPALVDIPRDLLLAALQVDRPSIIEIPTDPDEMPRPARLAEVQAPDSR